MTDSLIFSLIYFSFPSFCFFVLHFGRFLSNLKYLSSRSSISVISFSYRTVNIQSPIFIPWISLLTSFYSCFMNGLFSLFSLKISIMDSWKFIFLTCFWFLWSILALVFPSLPVCFHLFLPSLLPFLLFLLLLYPFPLCSLPPFFSIKRGNGKRKVRLGNVLYKLFLPG